MNRRWQICLAIGGALALLALPRTATAQGYSVNEHSACATARGGTAVASPCPDGSAMVYNPAGLTHLKKGENIIAAGVTLIMPSGGFTNDNTLLQSNLEDHTYPVPTLYLARGFTDKLSAGIGLFAPYGLSTEWPTTSEGRFLGYKSVIKNFYIQPTIAYNIHPKIQIGAGLDINFSSVQLRQHLDLSAQNLPAPAPAGLTFGAIGIPTGTDFADVNLQGSGTSVGGHFGVIIKPMDQISLGVRYMTQQTVNYNSGTVDITQINTGILLPASLTFPGGPTLPKGTPIDLVLGQTVFTTGPLIDQGATSSITNPSQWTFGVAFDPTPKFKVLFDVTLTQWSVFDTLSFSFDSLPTQNLPENYNNVTAYRVGAQYSISPKVDARVGFIDHEGAAPAQTVTPNLPEGARTEFTAGLGFQFNPQFHLDLSYMYINQADRRGRTVSDPTVTNGLYNFSANLFGASLAFSF
jgi:long-chain fatty acid transport protein